MWRAACARVRSRTGRGARRVATTKLQRLPLGVHEMLPCKKNCVGRHTMTAHQEDSARKLQRVLRRAQHLPRSQRGAEERGPARPWPWRG
eukprot:3172919-Alexandrium_andersonii.AAC.1